MGPFDRNELDLTVYHSPGHVGLENASHFCANSHKCTTRKQRINMHNLPEQWRERGSLSKAGSRTKRADYDVETSRRTDSPCRPPVEEAPLLRFVRPQVNKLLHRHHYTVPAIKMSMRLGSLHRKFHSDLSNERVNVPPRPAHASIRAAIVGFYCSASHCVTIRTRLKVLIKYCYLTRMNSRIRLCTKLK